MIEGTDLQLSDDISQFDNTEACCPEAVNRISETNGSLGSDSKEAKERLLTPIMDFSNYTYLLHRSIYYRRAHKGYWEYWSIEAQAWNGVHNFSLKRELTRHAKIGLWIVPPTESEQIAETEVIEEKPSKKIQFGHNNLDLSNL